MANDLMTRFKVVLPDGKEPFVTTTAVDANYVASQNKVPEYVEEVFRERTPAKVEWANKHETEPTDEPSPEAIARQEAEDAAAAKADEQPAEEDEVDPTKPVFGVRVPRGTSLLSHSDSQRSRVKRRDPDDEQDETLGDSQPVKAGRVVSPTNAANKTTGPHNGN